jgi:hypothetical protein
MLTPCSLLRVNLGVRVRVRVKVKVKVNVKVKVKFSPLTCREEHRKEITGIILLIYKYCARRG